MEGYNPTNLIRACFPRLRDNQNLVRTVQSFLYEESGSEQSKGRIKVATMVITSGLKSSFPILPLLLGVLIADGSPRSSAEIAISLKGPTSPKVIPAPQESPLPV